MRKTVKNYLTWYGKKEEKKMNQTTIEQQVKDKGLRAGFYRFKNKNFYIVEFIENNPYSITGSTIRAFEVFEDGSGISSGFQESYMDDFNKAMRNGKLKEITREEAFKKQKPKQFKMTLSFDEEHMKGMLEGVRKFYKMKNKSDKAAIYKLINLGLRQYHEDWDETGQ